MSAAHKLPTPEEVESHVDACKTPPDPGAKFHEKRPYVEAVAWLIDHGLASDWPRIEPEKVREAVVQGNPTLKYVIEQRKKEQRKAKARMRCLAGYVAEEVEWLWPGRIPIGTVSLVAGDPGAGKSTLMRAIITTVTLGACWPDQEGSHAQAGSVVYLTAEENVCNVVMPALIRMGADLDRIHMLETIEREDGSLSPFSMTRDVPLLEEAIAEIGDVRLVVIDPVGCYMGGTDTHKTAEVLESLNPLLGLAEKYKLAVVLSAHLNKGGGTNVLYRIGGAIAFAGTARMAWFSPNTPTTRPNGFSRS